MKKKRVPAIAAARKVVIDFPEPLLRETDEAVEALSTNRSKLIRLAVEQYLETLRRKRLEEQLAEGYRANAERDRQIAEEFASVE